MSYSLLQETIRNITPLDQQARARARARLERLTMPYWALGRLLDLAEHLCAISGQVPPPVERRCVVLMAADHGVAEEGVSQYPQTVTAQMVANFAAGGAGINALARVGNARLLVADLGVKADLSALVRSGKILDRKIAPGTRNFAREPAMTREQALQALTAGIEIALEVSAHHDLLAAGEMGIANTTPATAILCAVTGADPLSVTGKGTGIDEETRQRKALVIRSALEKHRVDARDGIDILSKVGGFEIAAITGFYLGAASRRKPIVLDGFICSAAALVAQTLCPQVSQYMIAAHRSAEIGHGMMLETLGLSALLNLDFRLGEGTGAAMSFPIFDAARSMLTDVATFEEAQVSDKVNTAPANAHA